MYYYNFFFVFFFNDTATTEIYTLSLHDALPISRLAPEPTSIPIAGRSISKSITILIGATSWPSTRAMNGRSEEHTSELQSQSNLVCRLLLEKKKNNRIDNDLKVHLQELPSSAHL